MRELINEARKAEWGKYVRIRRRCFSTRKRRNASSAKDIPSYPRNRWTLTKMLIKPMKKATSLRSSPDWFHAETLRIKGLCAQTLPGLTWRRTISLRRGRPATVLRFTLRCGLGVFSSNAVGPSSDHAATSIRTSRSGPGHNVVDQSTGVRFVRQWKRFLEATRQ